MCVCIYIYIYSLKSRPWNLKYDDFQYILVRKRLYLRKRLGSFLVPHSY